MTDWKNEKILHHSFEITPKLINPRKPSVKETMKKKLGLYFSGDVQTGNASFGEPSDNL